jgi:hypothetical protein
VIDRFVVPDRRSSPLKKLLLLVVLVALGAIVTKKVRSA